MVPECCPGNPDPMRAPHGGRHGNSRVGSIARRQAHGSPTQAGCQKYYLSTRVRPLDACPAASVMIAMHSAYGCWAAALPPGSVHPPRLSVERGPVRQYRSTVLLEAANSLHPQQYPCRSLPRPSYAGKFAHPSRFVISRYGQPSALSAVLPSYGWRQNVGTVVLPICARREFRAVNQRFLRALCGATLMYSCSVQAQTPGAAPTPAPPAPPAPHPAASGDYVAIVDLDGLKLKLDLIDRAQGGGRVPGFVEIYSSEGDRDRRKFSIGGPQPLNTAGVTSLDLPKAQRYYLRFTDASTPPKEIFALTVETRAKRALVVGADKSQVGGQVPTTWQEIKGNGVPATSFIIGAAAASNPNSSSSGSGTLFGLQQSRGWASLTGLINLATNVSVRPGDYGAHLLSPKTGGRGALFKLGIISNNANPSEWGYGLYSRLGFTSADYEIQRSDTGSKETTSGTLLQTGIGLQLVSPANAGTSFGAEAGLAYRRLAGSIASSDDLRQSAFHMKKKDFLGFEGRLFMNMNGARPYAQVTWFPRDIDGFSDWQIVLGIDALTSAFNIGGGNSDQGRTEEPKAAPQPGTDDDTASSGRTVPGPPPANTQKQSTDRMFPT